VHVVDEDGDSLHRRTVASLHRCIAISPYRYIRRGPNSSLP